MESRSLVSYLRNCENIDTDCLSIKSDPIGNVFICLTDEQSFFHDRQLLSGNCSESDKANWPSDNQTDVFLKFFQCVHRKLLSRRVRTEEQICRRDPQIQNKDIIMFCAPCFFLVTAQRCHFTSSVNKTKDYSHRELSRRAYNTYYSNILCLKRSLNCTVCGTCVPLTADALQSVYQRGPLAAPLRRRCSQHTASSNLIKIQHAARFS